MKYLNRLIIVFGIVSIFSPPSLASNKDEKSSNTRPFSFALIGDTPYGVAPGTIYEPFDRMRKEINDDHSIKWVLHAGDIKSGSSACSDELLYDRLERFNQFKKPFILTPGDNEWTDCHRVRAGEYQPLERLARLREIFFNNVGETLGKKTMFVDSQAVMYGYEEFSENVMWHKQRIVFSSIHIVGSQNGLKAFDRASSAKRTVDDDLEVARRTKAAIDWINKTFDKALSLDAPGVFIMIHANPLLEFKWLLDRDDSGIVDRYGFDEFLHTLEARTSRFGKPVILAHGDSHWFRVDKPELPSAIDGRDRFHSNFTRVETFGASQVNWVKVKVNPATDEVFQFEQMQVKGNN